MRDAILTFVLTAVLPYGQALTVALASRVMLVAGDLLLAALAAFARELVPGSRRSGRAWGTEALPTGHGPRNSSSAPTGPVLAELGPEQGRTEP